MSLGKESPHLMTAAARPEHMVCSEPLCPTLADPFTGRIFCRCYQSLESRDSTGIPHMSSASPQTHYPGLYPPQYGLEAASPVAHPLVSPVTNPLAHGGRWDPSMFSTSGYSSPFPAGTSVPQMENVLRSQMYNYMYPAMFDLSGARRKNATRETTSSLKAWLVEHKKNPYPTKAEKIMLAIVTKMTLTQVSTWFANARRRLKKETKGDWSLDSSLDTSTMSSDEEERSGDDQESKDELAQRLGQVPEISQNQMAPNMMTFQPANTGSETLPSFASFTSAKLHDTNGSSSPVMTGQVPNVYPNSHFYQSGHSHTPHEYSVMTHSQGFGHFQMKQEADISASGSDDSDKENTDLSKTSISPRTSPDLPKSRIWSISDIMGGKNTQKIENTVTKVGLSSENSIAS